MSQNQKDIRLRALLKTGAKKPGELQQTLGISQPTLSRLMQRNKGEIVTLGSTRSTMYALSSPILDIGAHIPIYQVETSGDIRPYGTLITLAAKQYYWQPISGNGLLYNYLPWFIESMRPEGFLGRAFAHTCQGMSLPDRLADWSDRHLLTALIKGKPNTPGNLIIGETAASAYLDDAKSEGDAVLPEERSTLYPKLAAAAMAGEPPGSSAGGEQPKFCVMIRENDFHHVLVKFSPPLGTNEGQRWSDLLICEHIALQTMAKAGKAASISTILFCGQRCFLEVVRFDRIGRFGRRGVTNLGILENEFTGGDRDSWQGAAFRLEQEDLISLDDATNLRWQEAFGKMIANTDQHFRNISFFTDDSGTFRHCPAYDVLPMFYRPAPSGELVERYYEIPSATVGLAQEWDDAQNWAQVFWGKVSQDERISESFKAVAQRHVDHFNTKQGPRMLF